MQELKINGWGIRIIPLDNKDKYFRKIGARATEKLVNNSQDIVVGLPDLYPNSDYANTEFKHRSLKELCDVQTRIVKQNLEKCVSRPEIDDHISRFFPSALKHDLEVLLLAATPQLQLRLKMPNPPRGWRLPPEEQNQEKPPKRIVEALFLKNLKRAYLPTTDSDAILRNADLGGVTEECPTFRSMVEWVGEKTGVPGC